MNGGTPEFLLLNGPNLNMLGRRNPKLYGYKTLSTYEQEFMDFCEQNGIMGNVFQSNHEGQLIEVLQSHRHVNFMIINAAAYGHTSLALRDALLDIQVRFVEVHLSNVFAREECRKTSMISDLADSIIMGAGDKSYQMAQELALHLYNKQKYKSCPRIAIENLV